MDLSTSQNEQKMWMWKLEPVSPSGTPKTECEDDWVLFDDKPVDIPKHDVEPVMYEDQHTRAQVATKLLEELDEWIKEEPFSDWLEEKIDLPIFEELPVPESGLNKPTIYTNIRKTAEQDDTQTLLQEFETVLGDVEACHQVVPSSSSTLTPPQSPPAHKPPNVDTQLLVTLQPVQQIYESQQSLYNIVIPESRAYIDEQVSEPWNHENVQLDTLSTDVANELAAVEEYVRSHTDDLQPSSPCTSSGGSYTSSEDSVDDPDWSMDDTGGKSAKHSFALSRNRHKPYSRTNVEDKKVRKKEQNKNAATRYRQKKKQEIKEILGEERELADHNEQLQSQVKDLQREIGYLKNLMRDLFRAKGLIK